MHIEASHAVARTIFIDTDAVRPSQFDLSDAEREQLYTKGRQAATDFLDGTDDQDAWDFDRYRERFRTGRSEERRVGKECGARGGQRAGTRKRAERRGERRDRAAVGGG